MHGMEKAKGHYDVYLLMSGNIALYWPHSEQTVLSDAAHLNYFGFLTLKRRTNCLKSRKFKTEMVEYVTYKTRFYSAPQCFFFLKERSSRAVRY